MSLIACHPEQLFRAWRNAPTARVCISSRALMLSFHWGTTDGVEDMNRCAPGGFHPVHLGNTFWSDKATYRVLNKLGHGSFSTVWLARTINAGYESSSGRYVALKICVADADPSHELAVHARLPCTHQNYQNYVIQLLDSFSLQGPNGTHVVLVTTSSDLRGTPNLRGWLQSSCGSCAARLRKASVSSTVMVWYMEASYHFLGFKQFSHFSSFLRRFAHGNIGICLPHLDEHSEDDILDYFGHPEIHLVLPCQPHAQAESLPLYRVPSIKLGYYYKWKDASFTKSSLCVEIMDLGNAALAGEDPRPSCTAPVLYEIVCGSSLFHWAQPNDALLEKMVKLCGEMFPEWQEHIPDVASTISAEGADVEWEMLGSRAVACEEWSA
ncbi:hypothetical protein BDZ97DRAFT_1913376 [Flammula alnicola]|nr:hypothetical protein BDZ97DRAFT_1913376 [Flammula alnicola]